jgi:hypothetical protein
MPDYIKRIQSRLSSKNIELTRKQIVAEIHIPVEDIQDSDVSGIVEYFIQSNQQPGKLTIPQNNYQDEMIEDLECMEDSNESSIILTDTQKDSLIQNASQQLGITLVGNEVKEISRSISSQFSNRRQMLLAITDSITAFNERVASEEAEIMRDFLSAAKGQLSASNQTIKKTFKNLEAEISQNNLDFKSLQTDILSLFTVS